MNFIEDQFYGVNKGKVNAFARGFTDIFSSIQNSKSGVYLSDNLFVWERNLSFLKNKRLMKAFKNNAAGKFPSNGILWRIATLTWAAENGLKIDGDFVECGCYKGISAKVVVDYVNFSEIRNKKYYLYDLFEHNESFSHHAMPEHSETLYNEVKQLFKNEKNVQITKGNLPDTLLLNCPEKISFLHLDLNNAESEIGTLEVLFDKMVSGSILILDDFGWGAYNDQSEKEIEWFANRDHTVLELPTGQGIVVKK